jgi:VCBS repeat protein
MTSVKWRSAFFGMFLASCFLQPLLLAQLSYRASKPLGPSAVTRTKEEAEEQRKIAQGSRFRGWKHTGNPERFRTCGAACLPTKPGIAESRLRPLIQPAAPPMSGFNLRPTMPAGAIPTSVAVGDFNADGHLDWVVSNGADNSLWLYLGRGDGTANLPTIIPLKGLSPVWVTAVDLRSNGILDLVVAEADSGTIGVLLGNGDGTFQLETEYQLTVSPLFVLGGDFNGDGKLDIAVGLFGTLATGPLAMLPGDGQGHLGAPLSTAAQSASVGQWLATADLNGDGKPDLIVVDPDDDLPHGGAQVYLNNGNGTFSEGQLVYSNALGESVFALTAALVDLNADGCVDAVVTDSLGIAYVFTGNCSGTFNKPAFSQYSLGDVGGTIQLVDLNRDGNLDIVTSGVFLTGLGRVGIGDLGGNLVSVLLGDGTGHFSRGGLYRAEPSMFGSAVGDLNGDGFPDLITANEVSNSSTVFLNDGKGGFGDPQGEIIGYDSGTVNSPDGPFVLSDVDGNGTQDIVFLQIPPLYPGLEQITSLLNDGTGKFSAPIRSPLWNTGNIVNPGDFVLADFRNTGRPDALIDGLEGEESFILFAPNIGGGEFGQFTMTTVTGASGPLAVGDFNGDGKLDFVTAWIDQSSTANVQELGVFLGNGDGTFGRGPNYAFADGSASARPSLIYTGDFNRDGKLDLLVWDGGLYEFLGNGDGTFQPARFLFPSFGSFTLADVNRDGWPDIVAFTDGMGNPADYVPTVSVFLGQADGTFKLSESYTPYLDTLLIPYDFGGSVPAHAFEAVLADFNADGNPDLALFQTPALSDRSFVQILYGNGDGTFTPTYGAYWLNKPFVPEFAVDLNGDGRADLIEQDNLTSSFNVVKSTSVATGLQLQILSTPFVGGTGYGRVTLTLPSNSATPVSLTASDPNVMLPSVTVPAGSTSQDFQFSIGAGFNPATVFSVLGQAGSATAVAYGYQPPGPQPFVDMEPTAVLFGNSDVGFNSAPQSVTVKNLGSAAFTVDMISMIEPWFSQTNDCGATVPVGGSCIVQVTFLPPDPELEPGALRLFYNGGYLQAVDLDGFGAGLQIVPCCLSFTANVGSTSPAQTITVTNSGTRSLQLKISPSINGFFETNDCGTLNGGSSCHINVTFQPSVPGLVTGGIEITDTAPKDNQYGASLSGTGIPAPDFSLSSSTNKDTVTPGQPATYDLSVTSVNGFSGMVGLSCSVAPGGPVCTTSASSVNVSTGQPASFTLTVSTSTSTAALIPAHPSKDTQRSIVLWTSLGTVFVGGIFCYGRVRKRKGTVTAVLLLLLMCSCGGGSTGSGTSGGSSSGTPAAAYTVIVKAVNGATAHTITLSLTVQ